MRLGVYGGTFSPPHVGHVRAARAFSREMSLDKLLIIPASVPPHKKFDESVTNAERMDMCRLAFSGVGEVSDIEMRRSGKSYTYDTLCELSPKENDIYLLCGTDMLLSFETWHRFEDILKMCSLVLCLRAFPSESERLKIEEMKRALTENHGARIYELDVLPTEISSTKIRDMIKRGDDASEFISAEEYEYIKEKGLYL